MTVQYSIQKMVSDGTLSTITLGIQYLQRNDIYMRIAGEETPQSGAHSGYTWSFINNTTLKILPVVPNGVEVVVYRRTDVDAMYNIYSQNAQFDEATIDENNQQLLYIAQEYFEQGIPGASIEALEYVRATDDGYYYRFKLTDGSYTPEFLVPISPNTKLANRAMWTRFAAESGYVLAAGDFETGGMLLNNTQVLLDESTQGIYAWSGAYPVGGYVVAPGTDPTAAGSGYVSRTDVVLRGDSNIVVKTFSSIAEMVSDGALTIGMHVKWESYHAGLFLGGNRGVVVAANTGSADGGVYFTLANGLQVKSFTPNAGYAVTHFGAVGDGAHTTQDTAAFQASANLGETILVPKPIAYYGIDTSNGGAGIVPANTGTKFISLSLSEIRLMSSRCNIFSNFLRDFTLPDYGPINDFYCEGIYFNSNKDGLADPASSAFTTGDNYSFGVYMVKCKNVELRNCKFANSWYGGHNLFSVLGQKVISCEYSNIGPSNAYYPDYAAMGSDADYRALSGSIIYRDIAVNNCGAVLRANGGINNGQTGISKKWLIENLSASDCLRGVTLSNSGYDDILFKHIRFNNISKGRLISVSGEGAKYSRATPVSNVRYEDVMAIDCLNDASATNSALFYINASSGVNSVENISIIGGNSSGNANDLIVFSGEYTGASTQAAGQFIVDKYKIKTAGTTSSHVRLNTPGQISIKRVTHDSLASVKMLNIAAGSDVDISDNDVIASGFVASSYTSKNWSKGSLRNIRGFKTYAAGLASVANNGTVAHGLVEAPPMINATMRQAGTPYIIGVTADANNIVFAITDNAGVVVSSPVSVAWEARCWHEIPL